MKTRMPPKTLYFWSYECDGQDVDYDYFTFGGHVRAISEEAVRTNVEWMVKQDYKTGHIFTLLIRKRNSAIEMDTSGATCIFDTGPVPSFLEDDGEPWEYPDCDTTWFQDQEDERKDTSNLVTDHFTEVSGLDVTTTSEW